MNPVEVNIRINQSREKIWKAISEPELMKNWFFDNIPDFKAEVGFKTWFIVKNEDRIFYHLWEVGEFKVNEYIKVDWTYPDYVKESFQVSFYLESLNKSSTLFKVIANGIEKFQHLHIPEFKRESCVEGWKYFMNRLKEFVEKQ